MLSLAGGFDNFSKMATQFNWGTPSWSLFILLAWVAISIVYSFATGRGRALSILLSIYVAKLLVLEAPFLTNALTKNFNLTLVSLQQLAAFVVIFLALFLFLGRFVFRTSADGRHMSSMVFGLIFSFLQVGLLISIVLSFLPQPTQNSLEPLIQTLFVKNPASFIWLLAPMVYLILLGKFVGHRDEA